jgi:hypothetical protein
MTVAAGARRASRLLASIAMALAILPAPQALAAGPAAAPAAIPRGTPAVDARAATRPFRIDLARDGDYVRQSNFVQCVGASVQMMLNIIEPGADRTKRTQLRLQVQARSFSGPRPDGRERQGAGVFGWAAALNLNDGGPYGVVGTDTLAEAMRVAALSIVRYRRPVGLLVWRGRHAWVMSGFEATGDPRTGSFRVTKAYILDPLHPFGSRAWGPSPRPGTAISVRQVGRQFVPRRIGGPWSALPGMAALSGKYVLVVPTASAPARIDKDDPGTLLVSPPGDPPIWPSVAPRLPPVTLNRPHTIPDVAPSQPLHLIRNRPS